MVECFYFVFIGNLEKRGLETFDINDLYKNGFVETSTETGDTKVFISLNELQLENVKDVYMSDFGKDEIYVFC